MKDRIAQIVEEAIGEKVFPGCVVGVISSAGTEILPFGRFTYDEDSEPVLADSVYDVASVTKSIPLASIMLHLIEKGLVATDDPVVKYLPEFANLPGKELVTIKHLLTYTLDIEMSAMASLKNNTADEIIEVVMKAPLRSAPGTRYLYTNSTALLSGLIVRKVTGKNIEDLAEELFFWSARDEGLNFFSGEVAKAENRADGV